MKTFLKIKTITYCGVTAGLAYALSYFKLFTMPQGGSVTLACVPIVVLAFSRGPLDAFISGAVLGVLKILTTGYVVGWLQAFLDYPAAYAVLAFAGASGFSGRTGMFFSVFLAFFLKFIVHIVSGYFFWGKSLAFSIAYNAAYGLPEMAISVLALYYIVRKNIISRLKNQVN